MSFILIIKITAIWLKFNFSSPILEKGVLLTTRPLIEGRVFYVSPYGSDKNEGYINSPWRSFKKAATTLKSGDTALFLKGTYHERGAIRFSNSGTTDRPIVYKSVEKHGAAIIFSKSLQSSAKIQIKGKQHLKLENFTITQESRSTEGSSRRTSDIMIVCSEQSKNIEISGNKIYSCYEDGIKIGSSQNIRISNNIIYDTDHEGIDVVNSQDVLVENNTVEEVGRVGIMIKGGSKRVVVTNNIVRSRNKYMRGHGITIGGSTFKSSTSNFLKSNFEAEHVLVSKNVVIAEYRKNINNGISFMGANECYLVNNIIIGSKTAVGFYSPNGIKNGWNWDPITTNPLIRNNIFVYISETVYKFKQNPVNFDSDFNLFFQVPEGKPLEPNSLYGDPRFIDINADWHLRDESPGISKGSVLSIPSWLSAICKVFEGPKYPEFLDKKPSMGIYSSSYNN